MVVDLKGAILLRKRAAQKAALRISMKLKNYFLEKIESNEYPITALHKKGLDCFQNKK